MKEDLFQNFVFVSLSNEWSGIIGNNFRFLFITYWWIAICPIFLLTLTVLAFKLMLEGYQSVESSNIIKDFMEDNSENEFSVKERNVLS